MTVKDQKIKGEEELEKFVTQAIKKVDAEKENDLCKYIPGPTGGYIHHFTLRKLKKSDPQEYFKLLQKFIIESDSPKALDPKPRAPRGSRKRRDVFNFTRHDLERVIALARKTGDKDLLARFSPRRSVATLRRELIRAIREDRVDHELWEAWAEAVTPHHN